MIIEEGNAFVVVFHVPVTYARPFLNNLKGYVIAVFQINAITQNMLYLGNKRNCVYRDVML